MDLARKTLPGEESRPKRLRRAGRRPKLGGDPSSPSLTRDDVIDRLFNLAQREEFAEVTASRLAKELGVVPSLIHYFLGSREEMFSLVINRALEELAKDAPPLTGLWRVDVEAQIRLAHHTLLRWKSITTYMVSQNKYRIFQNVAQGEKDYGLAFYDRIGQIFKSGGFTSRDGAYAYHLLMLLLTSLARAQVYGQGPAEQRGTMVSHVGRFPTEDYPGANFLLPAFINIDTGSTLERGIKLLLDGFERWLDQ